ncbi:hypothetical protein C9374_013485 [Naegleria lovaniensis]|uniref:Uncharacterized protein n=1 Tax=Naegleria lovaniensis TaxID=51637 RepID=A0AA88GW19_NAELO|nr:uncharacterized protein C9374_013485 [Naegleria lovaniensis]KAG2392000.1 hypothetical protein C9374_013485 [Naegleria lovaniensis]
MFSSKTNNSQWATDELTNILNNEPNVSNWTYQQVHIFLCSEPELVPQKVLKRVKQEEWNGADLLEKGCSWYYLTKFLKLSSSDATSVLLAVDKLKKRTGLPYEAPKKTDE